MDLNVLIRGQSNALLFADRGGAAALEQGLEARLGVDVHLLCEWGTDSSTVHSGTAFMSWDTDGQQASLLRYVDELPADIKDNPTATVWMHNEYDQNNGGLTADAWVGEVRADAALVRGALGQGAETTPYTFVPIRYPYGGNWTPIGDGMAAPLMFVIISRVYDNAGSGPDRLGQFSSKMNEVHRFHASQTSG